MKYDEFKEKLLIAVKERYDGKDVDLIQQVKNNGQVKDSFKFVSASNNDNVCKLMSINTLYDENVNDSEIIKIADKIVKSLSNGHELSNEDLNFIKKITKFDDVKDQIMPMFINTELNKEYLETVPNRNMLDLSIIYYISLDIGSIKIQNNIMDVWGITEEELYDIAMINLLNKKYNIISIKEFVMQMLLDPEEQESEEESEKLSELSGIMDDNSMIIIKMEDFYLGAVVCLNDQALAEVAAKIGSGYYFVFSSISEAIAFDPKIIGSEKIKDMLVSINNTSVSAEERLSDNVYYYDAEKNEVSMVC